MILAPENRFPWINEEVEDMNPPVLDILPPRGTDIVCRAPAGNDEPVRALRSAQHLAWLIAG